jgi:hypothetical protein
MTLAVAGAPHPIPTTLLLYIGYRAMEDICLVTRTGPGEPEREQPALIVCFFCSLVS